MLPREIVFLLCIVGFVTPIDLKRWNVDEEDKYEDEDVVVVCVFV